LSRKPQKPHGSPGGDRHAPDRVRAEMMFDRPELLRQLFGQYDENLIALENRLGVAIAARGERVSIEGPGSDVARARDVLEHMHKRLKGGGMVDMGDLEGAIHLAAEPQLAGLTLPDAPSPIMIRTRKKTILPRSPTQVRYMEALASEDLIFALGPAGTGKTYVAVAQAVQQLLAGSVERIILSRPAVEAGEKLGFLPGDMKDKVDPYLRPLYDALNDMLPAEQVAKRIEVGDIEVAPLAFMRGRTLANAFIILDEAQNATIPQTKMFLTRFGMGSRMVVCGDPRQTDLPAQTPSGLNDAVGRLEGVNGIGTVRFGSADVVRHPLVGRIVQAYEGE